MLVLTTTRVANAQVLLEILLHDDVANGDIVTMTAPLWTDTVLDKIIKQMSDHDPSQEVETTDSDNVGLLTMIDIDKDWQRLDKHERKVVKMVNYDLDKIDDSDR